MGRGAPGKAPLTYEGAYDAGRRYTPREVATDGGLVYMALARTIGETPAASPAAWLLLGGGHVLYVSTTAAGPPTDGSVLWIVTDQTCSP